MSSTNVLPVTHFRSEVNSDISIHALGYSWSIGAAPVTKLASILKLPLLIALSCTWERWAVRRSGLCLRTKSTHLDALSPYPFVANFLCPITLCLLVLYDEVYGLSIGPTILLAFIAKLCLFPKDCISARKPVITICISDRPHFVGLNNVRQIHRIVKSPQLFHNFGVLSVICDDYHTSFEHVG